MEPSGDRMPHGLRASRGITILLWIVVLTLTLNLRHDASARVTAEVSDGVVPFTVTLEQRLPGVSTQLATWAVRSDGSRAIRAVVHFDSGANPMIERILDFSAGKRQYIFELKRRKSTIFDPQRVKPEHWLRNAASSCILVPRERFAGEEQVAGFRAAKVVHDSTTDYYALDYGCAPLGGGMGTLVSLKRGEPSAELFADPADFQEVRPSGLFSQASRQDDAYYATHRP